MISAFRPHILRLEGYLPGEQPQGGGYIKLNTNENPYPPSPGVLDALGRALTSRLRLYPDPLASEFRCAAADLHGVEADMILVGNGSDDLLTILTRAFVGPGDLAAYLTPSYLLYSTLIRLQDGRGHEVPYSADWSLKHTDFDRTDLKLVYLANPNSPSGTSLPSRQVAELARRIPCPLVVDEAYADFADGHCLSLISDHPNVIVTRSFSKGYSLAGIRLGYLVAQASIVDQLLKVKDSYNCDALSLVAGVAAIEDQDYLRLTRSKVLSTRRRLTARLQELGYGVPDSQANFVWATGGPPARETFEHLKKHRILVRLMSYPGYPAGLRISVGDDNEIDSLLQLLTKRDSPQGELT
jgi:histidinol-phosphate aminotransferase